MPEHKNKSRAPIHPLNLPTVALTSFGLGFLRPAPGTWGSLPPAAFAAAVVLSGMAASYAQNILTAMFLLACFACVIYGQYAETRFGRKDAAEVVADEVAGCCIPMVFAMSVVGTTFERLAYIAAAFVLFRIFDILKPWPGRALEKLPAGWGVLMDDIAAGVYALGALIAGLWLFG